jgi:tryptophan synthase alpha chain
VTGALDQALERARADGRKIFVPYVTGGLPAVTPAVLRSVAACGADAIEVGVPFSDPIMDGPIIQEASRRALKDGATPTGVLELVRRAEAPVPVVLMTYLNPVMAFRMERFAAEAAAAGVAGVIIPDLPVDEADQWIECARAAGVATVFLAAPNSAPARLAEIVRVSEGFVYCVGAYGVTGSRERLAGSARSVVEAVRPLTRTPLIVGVGISTPAQAAEACGFADGVVVGTALVARLLENDAEGFLDLARSFRDAATSPPE